jgi:hypothetical protein
MNNTTTMQRGRRLQGYYPTPEVKPITVHPIKQEIQKHIGTFSFTAKFEEDREANEAFKSDAVVAYRCELRHNNKVIGIGRGLNVLSQENRYLSKSVKWALSGSLIDAVTRATKLPDLNGVTDSFGPATDIASEFMATDKQKSYLKELIMSLPEEDGREELLNNLDSMTKEDASELIGQLKS